MGMRIRREFAGILCGSAGLIGAFALVFFAPVPVSTAAKDDQVSSWKAAGCIFGAGLYVAEIPLSLADESDADCSQCAVKSRPLAGFLHLYEASENLDATGNQSAPVSTLIRVAPKRGPPPAPLFI